MTDSAHILVVDNYDSFVYTIVGYLQTLGATVDVVRNALSTQPAGCTGRLRWRADFLPALALRPNPVPVRI